MNPTHCHCHAAAFSRRHFLQTTATGIATAVFTGIAWSKDEVLIPKWPTLWHQPPGDSLTLFDQARCAARGTRRKATVPDTLDLAELARQSVNVLVGNVEPHAQVFDFGVNPPRVTAGGAVLQKHLRFLPMLRAVCGSEQGLDIEARLMKSQLNALRNQAAISNSYYFGPGYGPLALALAEWERRAPDPLLREWIAWIARMMRENALIAEDRAFYPPSSLRDKAGKWFNGDPRGESPLPYRAPDEPSADQQGFEGTVKWEQALVLRALLRDFQLNENRDSLAMADGFARFILKPAMWEAGGPDNGAFAGHWHGNLWSLQGMLEYALVKNDERVKRIVVRGYEHARTNGVVAMGWFPSWLSPEKFKRPVTYAHVNETCGVVDMLTLAAMLSEAGLGDYWDDVDGIVRNHFTQMQFCDLDEMRRRSGGLPENDALLRRYVGGFGMGEPSAIKPEVVGCCSANGAHGLVRAWQGILKHRDGVTTVNLLLNRASPWLDVDSHLPHEGEIVLRIRDTRSVCVRIPAWLSVEKARATLDGQPATLKRDGRFLRFDELKSGSVIALIFDVPERTEKHTFAGREHTLTFRGGTVTNIEPRNPSTALIPLFNRIVAGEPVRFHEVERFLTAH